MFSFREAFNSWLRRRKLKAYRDGYDYAAGALLRYEESPASLRAYTYGSSDEFDRGVNAACRELIAAQVIEDDEDEESEGVR